MSPEDRQHGNNGSGPWPVELRRFRIRRRALVPCNREAINGAVALVLRVARRCGYLDDGQADLEIAAREALANAIIHGNGSRLQKKVLLRCYGDPLQGVLIVVRDEGGGFDPASVPDPRDADRKHLHHGRGLLLMRELMDFVQFRRGGREVVLFKACPTRG